MLDRERKLLVVVADQEPSATVLASRSDSLPTTSIPISCASFSGSNGGPSQPRPRALTTAVRACRVTASTGSVDPAKRRTDSFVQRAWVSGKFRPPRTTY
jgi:hypothetical protein